jgi:prophage regulatory protein
MSLIKLPGVMKLTTISKATVYKYMKQDLFPKNVSLGGESVVWVLAEVDEWVMDKIAKRGQQS